MIIPESHRSYLYPHSKWLPVINWNIKLFGAHMQQVKKGWNVPLESHLAFELILIIKGSQFTVMENLNYQLSEGDILLIPPGFKHVNQCLDDCGLTYFIAHFNVDDTLFHQEMSHNVQLYFPVGTEDNQKLKEGIMKWVTLLEREGEYSTSDLLTIQAGLFEILLILSTQVSASSKPLVTSSANHYARLIAEAIKSNFKEENIQKEWRKDQEIRIEEIAESLKISSGYALEVFQKVYGLSPRRYLSQLKLQEAKQLLHQPDLALTRIADMLGYSSLSHFSRQFKRWTGMSPREYRQTTGCI